MCLYSIVFQYIKKITIVNIYLLLDIDMRLALIISTSIMEANGWVINVTYDNTNAPGKECGDDTFYGWSVGYEGTISATFSGLGSVNVSFGNCYYLGYVNLFLNNVELARVHAGDGTSSHVVSYTHGDIILIKENGGSIIKLYSLDFLGNAIINYL